MYYTLYYTLYSWSRYLFPVHEAKSFRSAKSYYVCVRIYVWRVCSDENLALQCSIPNFEAEATD